MTGKALKILPAFLFSILVQESVVVARGLPKPDFCLNPSKITKNLDKIKALLGPNPGPDSPGCKFNYIHRRRYQGSLGPDQIYALDGRESTCLATLLRSKAKEEEIKGKKEEICRSFSAMNPNCLKQGRCLEKERKLIEEIGTLKEDLAKLLAAQQQELAEIQNLSRKAATDMDVTASQLAALLKELERNPSIRKNIPPFGILPSPNGTTTRASGISQRDQLEEYLNEIKEAMREHLELQSKITGERIAELKLEVPREQTAAEEFKKIAAAIPKPEMGSLGQRKPGSEISKGGDDDPDDPTGPPSGQAKAPPGGKAKSPPGDTPPPSQVNADPKKNGPPGDDGGGGGGAPDMGALANALKGLAGGGGGQGGGQQPKSQIQGQRTNEGEGGLYKMPRASSDGQRAIDPNAFLKEKKSDDKNAPGELAKQDEKNPSGKRIAGSDGISGSADLQNGITSGRGSGAAPTLGGSSGASSSGSGGSSAGAGSASAGKSAPNAENSGPLPDTYLNPSGGAGGAFGGGGGGSSGSGYLGKQNFSLDNSSDSDSIKKILADMEKNSDDPIKGSGDKSAGTEKAGILAGGSLSEKLRFGSDVVNSGLGPRDESSLKEATARFGGETSNLFFRMHTCLHQQLMKGKVINGIPKEI